MHMIETFDVPAATLFIYRPAILVKKNTMAGEWFWIRS